MEYSIHGANPEKLYEAYQIKKPGKVIDFSTNTNVLRKKIHINVNKLASSYPDYSHKRIKKIIGEKHNLKEENIMVTSGINEALYLLARMFQGKNVGILENDYTEYKRAFKHNDLLLFNNLDDVKDVDLLVLSNPNNPSGKLIDLSYLTHLKDTVVCIDESYMEFIEDKELKLHKNMIFLRSLTKIYHLSGVRIGYLIGDKELLDNLTDFQPTWSVNSIALKMGEMFLKDTKFMLKTRAFYKNESRYLKSKIKAIGYDVLESDANFFLIKVKSEIIPYLLTKGIVTRHTFNFPKYNGDYIRVSVKKRKDNNKLIKALKEYYYENISG